MEKTASLIETLKKYYGLKDPTVTIYVDTESTGAFNSKPTKPMYVTTSSQDLAKAFESFFDDPRVTEYTKTLPEPAVYNDMENIDNLKIAERFPKFAFGDLLDEILEDFGGVLDIFHCDWTEECMEGEVVCLMKDWRVFRYHLKQNELSSLNREARIKLINKDCILFEDVDDWSAWKELADVRIEKEKKEISKKQETEKSSVYSEKYNDALNDLFNGGIEAIQKIMSQNSNV
jgi:hypothetical protein